MKRDIRINGLRFPYLQFYGNPDKDDGCSELWSRDAIQSLSRVLRKLEYRIASRRVRSAYQVGLRMLRLLKLHILYFMISANLSERLCKSSCGVVGRLVPVPKHGRRIGSESRRRCATFDPFRSFVPMHGSLICVLRSGMLTDISSLMIVRIKPSRISEHSMHDDVQGACDV